MVNPSKPWLKNYPEGVPHDVDISEYDSLLDMFEESFERFPNRQACEYLGKFLTYRELDQHSRHFAAYLQSLGLEAGSRVAIMLPNVMQFQIAMLGVLRAGFVVVNVNPLYTARELEYQLKDSGASALIVLENFAHVYQQIAANVPLKKTIVTSMGEMIGIKGAIVNFVVRKVKKLVPAWKLPGHILFVEALNEGSRHQWNRPNATLNDIAFLQYTGGTTGLSKGAILLHKNILSNVIQTDLWLEPGLKRKQVDQLVFLCALPLYHIFALTACALMGMRKGGLLILVPNPRDFDGFIKLLKNHPEINIFPGVNTLFNALMHKPEFASVKFPNILATIGGGMAMQKVVADQWQKMTGAPIAEGYGLSETSPVACVNSPLIESFTGYIGLPVSGTEVVILGDDGIEVPFGTPGEICIRGPQVMAGYWNKPEETKNVMTADGFFKSGDIGIMNADGLTKIVDRKKDMVLVSGFNVYPNEVEEVLSLIPGVLECAVIGVPDEDSGEAVKAFVVKQDPDLTEGAILAYCKENLTNYKRPKHIVFRNDLPKTNVGKILRRELRDL
ncbi:long-chain-fatty-acid--CoA ligase [Polynucleobacter sp. MWH-Aus1W21]|uniref:long-chain-fatty-acid--CoA ligase n=1 Tax=Polynucleobacter sp. MWH-Aus1W21 TaxID=1855880 RepID=UPI001BFD20F9|nr:long-chain-fatty-acid--CoA ligase [Polynucleobacter sp. MWH-Aus1W21]QWD67124.1 long-chain-fatty-acid--CoA ligase [Polynucleobacter sp. MWH-Aus1W21]